VTRRALVTGASGFLGRQAIPALLERGFEVHATARRPPSMPGVPAHPLDLHDRPAVAELLRRVRPDYLLHLAWGVTPGRFWSAPENLDWAAASLLLFRAFTEAGGRRAVVAGTCAEYDWSGATFEEDARTRPQTLYGATKDALHKALAAAAQAMGAELAWARIFFLYGPYEASTRLVPSVILPLLAGEPAAIGEGLARRDFLHVADAAASLAAVLDSPLCGAVNIASGRSVSVREIAHMIAAQIGRLDLLRVGARPTQPDEPLELGASGRLLAELDFRPRFTLETGLADTIDWWRRHAGNPCATPPA
jgi:nucleoside-diphosphate-sugar epimerase